MSNLSKGPARTGRVPKLRLSCDACAAAKVKCSRDQPQCERCAASGTDCVYGQSRRSGKPPRDPNRQSVSSSDGKRGSTEARSNQPLHQDEQMFPLVQNEGPPMDLTHIQTGSWVPGSLPINGYDSPFASSAVPSPMAPIDDSMGIHDAVSSHQTTSGYSTASSQSPPLHIDHLGAFHGTLSSHLGFNPGDFQDIGYQLSQATSGSSSAATSSAGMSSDTNAFRSHPQAAAARQNSCGGRDCYNLAYSTLASLHYQQSFGSPISDRHGSVSSLNSSGAQSQALVPSLDSVLSNNKAAIQTVLQLLQCPCAADAHMALLYASITSKILIWYQIAAGITVSSSSPAAVVELGAMNPNGDGFGPAGGSAMHAPYSMGSTFADNPVKIGTFSADEEYQGHMRQVLFLGELGRAGKLIDALSLMHPTDGNGSSSSANGQNGITSMGQAGNLYATLGQWLQEELARTKSEVQNGSLLQMRV